MKSPFPISRAMNVVTGLCLLFPSVRPVSAQSLSAQLVRTFPIHEEGRYVAFSPDSRMLASSNVGPIVRIWSVPDGKELAMFKHPTGVTSVAFSPDGQTIVTGAYDALVRIWSVREGRILRTFKGSRGTVWAVAFSPDGKTIASGGEDSTAKLWRTGDGALLQTLKGHSRNVWSVGFSPDGRLLATGSFDKTAKVWRVDNGLLIRTITGHTQAVVHVAFSPWATLATGGDDNTVKFWNIITGKLVRTLPVGNHVYSMDFSADERWLVSAGRGRSAAGTLWHQVFGDKLSMGKNEGLNLWRVSDGTLLQTVLGHSNDVWSAALSRDGRWLASSSEDGSVKLWRLTVRQ